MGQKPRAKQGCCDAGKDQGAKQSDVSYESIIYQNYAKAFGAVEERFFIDDAIKAAMERMPNINDLLRRHLSNEDVCRKIVEMDMMDDESLQQLREYTVKQELVVKPGKAPRGIVDEGLFSVIANAQIGFIVDQIVFGHRMETEY